MTNVLDKMSSLVGLNASLKPDFLYRLLSRRYVFNLKGLCLTTLTMLSWNITYFTAKLDTKMLIEDCCMQSSEQITV